VGWRERRSNRSLRIALAVGVWRSLEGRAVEEGKGRGERGRSFVWRPVNGSSFAFDVGISSELNKTLRYTGTTVSSQVSSAGGVR
jgi:hypothetical protein